MRRGYLWKGRGGVCAWDCRFMEELSNESKIKSRQRMAGRRQSLLFDDLTFFFFGAICAIFFVLFNGPSCLWLLKNFLLTKLINRNRKHIFGS